MVRYHHRDIHHPDGSHRATPPTANGHDLTVFERTLRRHLERHREDVTMNSPRIPDPADLPVGGEIDYGMPREKIRAIVEEAADKYPSDFSDLTLDQHLEHVEILEHVAQSARIVYEHRLRDELNLMDAEDEAAITHIDIPDGVEDLHDDWPDGPDVDGFDTDERGEYPYNWEP